MANIFITGSADGLGHLAARWFIRQGHHVVLHARTWLAVSNDEQAKVSGRYFYHQKQKRPLAAAGDIDVQETFLSLCEQITGIHFPAD
jgi:NAD(P)-dependent dehydrogenase (short-subunit alcohol dehydrogenase family)